MDAKTSFQKENVLKNTNLQARRMKHSKKKDMKNDVRSSVIKNVSYSKDIRTARDEVNASKECNF